MCGNFGLVRLRPIHDVSTLNETSSTLHLAGFEDSAGGLEDLAIKQLKMAAKCGSVVYAPTNDDSQQESEFVQVSEILKELAAFTEFRGGQAGGISTFEFLGDCVVPSVSRVRIVGRKRYPLAEDLEYSQNCSPTRIKHDNSIVTALGHTRFATSSINIPSELHPHEWVPFRKEHVWQFCAWEGKYKKQLLTVGNHITHNGDFNTLTGYSRLLVNHEVGIWLEKVLIIHTYNASNFSMNYDVAFSSLLYRCCMFQILWEVTRLRLLA